jgi:hypothetical protein
MFKKMMLLAMMAFCLASTVAAATNQYPTPPCLPCGGGDGN